MARSNKARRPVEEHEMADEKPARWLTTIEAAQELDRSPQQLSLLIRQGKLPAQKRGRDWLIKEADLQLILNIPKDRPPGAKDSQPGRAASAAGRIATALRRGGSSRKGKS
jgi:excisionase family DNA binding protein